MKGGEYGTPPEFDKIIHERARLRILVYLASSQEAETGFTDIKKDLGMTAGNLSVQLGTLEEAGYIQLRKTYIGKKPYTGIRLTLTGANALDRYLNDMESVLSSLRKSRK